MEHLNTALGLLVVGMITVFIILWLVVVIGNLVVRVTNRIIPEKNTTGGDNIRNQSDSKKIAAIVAAVDVATQGRGKIDSITRQ